MSLFFFHYFERLISNVYLFFFKFNTLGKNTENLWIPGPWRYEPWLANKNFVQLMRVEGLVKVLDWSQSLESNRKASKVRKSTSIQVFVYYFLILDVFLPATIPDQEYYCANSVRLHYEREIYIRFGGSPGKDHFLQTTLITPLSTSAISNLRLSATSLFLITLHPGVHYASSLHNGANYSTNGIQESHQIIEQQLHLF